MKLKRGNNIYSRNKKHGSRTSNETIEERTEKQDHFRKRNHTNEWNVVFVKIAQKEPFIEQRLEGIRRNTGIKRRKRKTVG